MTVSARMDTLFDLGEDLEGPAAVGDPPLVEAGLLVADPAGDGLACDRPD